MLSAEQFANAMEILTQCLPTPMIEKRISGLYYFFSKESFETIRQAANTCANELDRFPTPKIFSMYVTRFRKQHDENRVECSMCDGFGLISALRKDDHSSFTFRCHCSNAAQYEKIEPWTKDSKEKFYLASTNAYQELHENPEMYEKGLNWMHTRGIFMPTDIKEKIRARTERAKKAKEKESEIPF